MKKPTPKVRLTTDISWVMFLVCTYLTGHADPYVHALLGMLLIVAVMVHAMQAHKKIAGMTQNLANRCVDSYTRLDCCTGVCDGSLPDCSTCERRLPHKDARGARHEFR